MQRPQFGSKIRNRKIPDAYSDFVVNVKVPLSLLSDHSDSPLITNALKTSLLLHSNGTVSWFSSVDHLLNLGCLDYQTLALPYTT